MEIMEITGHGIHAWFWFRLCRAGNNLCDSFISGDCSHWSRSNSLWVLLLTIAWNARELQKHSPLGSCWDSGRLGLDFHGFSINAFFVMLGRVAAKMITLSKKCLAFNAPPTILAGGNANETIEIATGMSTRRDCSDRNMEPSRYNRWKESDGPCAHWFAGLPGQ